jgi:hypothetical protein
MNSRARTEAANKTQVATGFARRIHDSGTLPT